MLELINNKYICSVNLNINYCKVLKELYWKIISCYNKH